VPNEENTTPSPDAWRLKRAAEFLGLSPRTLERYVTRRLVPCIVYESARSAGTRDARPIVAFDPVELAAWRESHKIGRHHRGD